MYLTASEIQKKYGISTAHCRRDLTIYSNCITKEVKFCNRTRLLYYEPDVKKVVEEKNARKKNTKERYLARPNVMMGTKSQLKKVLPDDMYTKLRNAWYGMMRRCYTNDRPDYHHYRESAITICDEWLENFDSFALWSLNHGVKKELELDRTDNEKGYCPENCRWVERSVNANNTSTNATVFYNGEEKTIAELAKEYGIKYHTLYMRLARGESIEESITTPVRRPSSP